MHHARFEVSKSKKAVCHFKSIRMILYRYTTAKCDLIELYVCISTDLSISFFLSSLFSLFDRVYGCATLMPVKRQLIQHSTHQIASHYANNSLSAHFHTKFQAKFQQISSSSSPSPSFLFFLLQAFTQEGRDHRLILLSLF